MPVVGGACNMTLTNLPALPPCICAQWVLAASFFYILVRLLQSLHFHDRLSAITRTIEMGLVDLVHFFIIFAVRFSNHNTLLMHAVTH